MRRRLSLSVALASTAALALVGCSQPVPSPEPTDSDIVAPASQSPATEEQLIVATSEAFNRFYQAIDEQFANGIASAEDLSQFATPQVARTWADAIQVSLDRGETSRGVLEITAIEVIGGVDPTVATAICTDGAGIVTTDAQGLVKPASGLVAWSATFTRPVGEDRFVVAGLEPVQNQTICTG